MKFKIGDKVRACGAEDKGEVGTIIRIDESNPEFNPPYKTSFGWKYESNLELVESPLTVPATSNVVGAGIRTFETGATRDTAAGKLSYMKALSPEVLEAYIKYLDKHRLQPDGSMREFDNWKKGIDKRVYLDSLLRHDKAVWKLMLGYEVSDNHGPVTLLDSLMAVIFNATGMAYELLIEEGKAKRCVQSS